MSRWFRVYDDLLDDPAVQRLTGAAFRKALFAAMDGKKTPFSRFLKPGYDRPSASIWASLRAETFRRDNFTCTYCGERGGRLECDHVIPVSRGGESDPKNLTTACFPCNRAKRARLVEEWLK